MTMPAATATRRLPGPGTSTTKARATITPHTTDGAQRNDSTVKAPMPISDPIRS